MTQVTAAMVKELREMTGAGMMDCKQALSESGGNIEEAVQFLRKKGLKSVEKRAGRIAAEGIVYSYIHAGGRIGVMLELNCETDFVARSDDFSDLAKEIAMHIAWAAPRYVAREEVLPTEIDREREVISAQLKPGQENVAEKIVSGKLEKFYEGICLLEQLHAKDPGAKRKIGDLVGDVSAKVGEKVVVRRFLRYEVGEGIEKPQVNYAEEVLQAANL